MKPEHKKYILNNIKNKTPTQISQELGLTERKIKKFLQKSKHSHVPKAAPVSIPEKPLNKRHLFLAHVLIIALGFMAYANSLNGKFLYDDTILIVNNTFIKSPSALINCFTKHIFAGEDLGRISNFYRPLQMVSYALNYGIGKLDVRGYHFVNMLLHISVALSIYWLVNILFSDYFLSLITAILFVVHPIHTDAVSYISGRADPLVTFFILISFILYLKLVNQDRVRVPGVIFLSATYLCALFSKEYGLILLFLLLLYHLVFRKSIKAMTYLPVLGVAALYIAIRFICLKSISFSFDTATNAGTVLDRLPGLFVAIFSYIKLLFFPFGLHMEYGQKIFGWADPKAIGGFIMTLIVLIWGCFKRSNKIICFSIGWFFLALIPVSNLYKINCYMAEHFLYMPSVGFFLLVAYLLSLLYHNRKYRMGAFILTSCWVVFFGALTIRQNDYWKDPLTFYKRTLELAPDSTNMYNNLGGFYAKNEDTLTQALLNFNKAIKTNSNNTEAYYNRGYIYDKLGRYDEAILDYNKAVALNPNYSRTYNNRGNTYNLKGNYDQAILDLNKAIELKPDYTEAYNNRGNTYNLKGDYDQAILDLNKAIELDSEYSQAYNNRGNSYLGKGSYDRAILDYNKAIQLKPDYFKAYNNRGNAYRNKGNYDRAISDYSKAMELSPHYAQAYSNRAIAYYDQKAYDKALSDLDKAQELGAKIDPEFFKVLRKWGGEN